MLPSVRSILLLLLFVPSLLFARQDEDLDQISGWLHHDGMEQTLYRHFSGEAYRLLGERNRYVESFTSLEEWEAYRDRISAVIRELTGPFPERTPLNARTLGRLERPEFSVEKIVFESVPGFYVTAALLLPKGSEEPAPAIVYASGHTADGFRADAYQHKIINLAKKGFVVLAFDPLGQGERLQYVDPQTGESLVGGPTHEHSFAGGQAFLTARSLASWMIWDGIRAVDYLLERDEVDPDRIGMTGRSGGGTQTAYNAAVDNRIRAAAPENYITSFEYLLKSIGPQDAEQNFRHGIASGVDHPDLLIARAPLPSLLIATTRDFFSIQGARETARQVRGFYENADLPGHFDIVEDDHGHGSTLANREAMYAFFRQHLNHPGPVEDLEVELFSDEELRVTPTGQVATSFEDAVSVFSLQADALRDSEAILFPQEEDPLDRIRRLSGYRSPERIEDPRFLGRYRRDGYSVELHFVPGEGEYVLPYLWACPERGADRTVIYLDPEGKSASGGPGGELEWLVMQGNCVLSADLPGTGELGAMLPVGDSRIGNVSYNLFFAAVQVGRSIPGLQAGEISRLVSAAMHHDGGQARSRTLIARRDLTTAALHAALFDTSIDALVLDRPLISWRAVALEEFYRPGWIYSLVAGALESYDLPGVAAQLSDRRLLYLDPLGATGSRLSETIADRKLRPVTAAFEEAGRPEAWKLRYTENPGQRKEVLQEWMRAAGER